MAASADGASTRQKTLPSGSLTQYRRYCTPNFSWLARSAACAPATSATLTPPGIVCTSIYRDMLDRFLDDGRPRAVPDSILVTQTGRDHDRAAAPPDRDTAPGTVGAVRAVGAVGTIDAALRALRLDGAIFFRAEFTERWAYQSATGDQMAAILRPGAPRLIIFHVVVTGACWVQTADGERVWARAGDVIVVPYGDQHSMGGGEVADEVPILALLDPPPWATLPVLRHGAGGERTDIVCGYLHSDHPLFNPALRALPPFFVVRPPEGPAATWIRSSVEYALMLGEPSPPPADPTATRLPELVLRETLRLHFATFPATAPGTETGWL